MKIIKNIELEQAFFSHATHFLPITLSIVIVSKMAFNRYDLSFDKTIWYFQLSEYRYSPNRYQVISRTQNYSAGVWLLPIGINQAAPTAVWQLGNFSIRQTAERPDGRRRRMQRQNFDSGIESWNNEQCWAFYSISVLKQSTYIK